MKSFIIVLVFILGIIFGQYLETRGYLGQRISYEKAMRDAHNVVVCEVKLCKYEKEYCY